MNRRKRLALPTVILLTMVLAFLMTPITAFSNAAAPPSFTIIVPPPPEGFELYLQMKDGQTLPQTSARRNQKNGWLYYDFYYLFENNATSFLVVTQEETFVCDLPTQHEGSYSRFLTLDFDEQKLIEGKPGIAYAMEYTFLRIVLTILIEGILLYSFGFREGSYWSAFLLINLFTQGVLNVILVGSVFSGYVLSLLIILEIVIILIELLLFLSIFKRDEKRGRLAGYVITANIASFILGGLLIMLLPV